VTIDGKYDRPTAISDRVIPARHRARAADLARRWGALAAVGAAGSVIVLITTRHNIGTNPDAAVYLSAARNVLDGRGVTTPFVVPVGGVGPRAAAEYGNSIPLTHFPPLFPLVVAAIARLGVGVETAVRWLNATLFGINLFLVGVLAVRVVRSRVIAGAVMILMIVGSVLRISLSDRGLHNTWLLLHSAVMTEPLFLMFTLLTLLILVPSSGAYTSSRAATIAAVFSGLALLTRYAAVATIITIVIVVVVSGAGTLRVRRRDTGIVLAIALLPTLLWTMYNALIRDGRSPRPFRLHPRSISDLFDATSGWFVPPTWPGLVRHAVLFVAVGLVLYVLTRLRTDPAGWPRDAVRLFHLLTIFVVVYVAVIVATRIFLDVSAPIDARYLAPLQPVMYILVLGAVRYLYDTRPIPQPGLAKLMCVALCLPIVGSGIRATLDTVRDGPVQLTLPAPTLFAVSAIPEDTFIASNSPSHLYATARKNSILVPFHTDALTGARNDNFDAELRELVDVVTERHGVVVIVGGDSVGLFGGDLALPADFRQFPQLQEQPPLSDGTVVFTTAPPGG
jgi:hypothetical protein